MWKNDWNMRDVRVRPPIPAKSFLPIEKVKIKAFPSNDYDRR